MELVILGTGGGWGGVGQAASGYLLRHEGFNVWLDAGTGTLSNLQEHIALLDVHAVIVSHRHFDHFLDLYPYFLAVWFDPDRSSRVPLYAPPGMFEHALQLEDSIPKVFESRPVDLGSTIEVGPFRIRTTATEHPVPTLGMRIEADGSALAYTADTGPSQDMDRLAAGADALLSEATRLRRPKDVPMALHITAAEAGEHAARAGVGRLILTHIWPTNDRTVAVEEAERAFKQGVVSAEEGMVFRL